jgi:hypothetical protein
MVVSHAEWCNKVLTPTAGSLGWVNGSLVGVTATIRGIAYVVESNTTTTLTVVSVPTLAWTLNITTTGVSQIVGNVLSPSPAPASWPGSNGLAGVRVNVHTSVADPRGGTVNDPSTQFVIVSNTTTALTLDGSPGDTENDWWLNGYIFTGIFQSGLSDFMWMHNAVFSKNMGPDPFDCMVIDDVELPFVSSSSTVCDYTGTTFHITSAHGHAASIPSFDNCVACPECGPSRSSYTLTFHGYANLPASLQYPYEVPCENCANYNTSFTVAHQFSGFSYFYSYGVAETTLVCPNMYYSSWRQYYLTDTITLKWTYDSVIWYTRSGMTVSAVGQYSGSSNISAVTVLTESGTGDVLPSSGLTYATVFSPTDPPDDPCRYSLTVDDLCEWEGGGMAISLSTSWDSATGQVQFDISNGINFFIATRNNCSPNGWVLLPFGVTVNIIDIGEDRSYITVEASVGSWNRMRISGSTANDGLYYVATMSSPNVYIYSDPNCTIEGRSTVPSTIADGTATFWWDDICDSLNAYVEVTAD